MKYYPDKWVMLKITRPNQQSEYKILASWYGGYGGSNSWKLSSGNSAAAIVLEKEAIEFPQYSGSSYVVHRSCYGMSGYTTSVYENWLTTLAENPDQGTVELLDQDFDLESVVNK